MRAAGKTFPIKNKNTVLKGTIPFAVSDSGATGTYVNTEEEEWQVSECGSFV